MNNNSLSNRSIDFKTLILANLRSSFLADALVLYLLVPMGVLGAIFNSIGLIVFSQSKLKKRSLFKYLIIYKASCLIIGLANIFDFYLSAYQLFDIASSYSARIFKCYALTSYVISFFFFYSNVLDVFINLERALNFSDKYHRFKSISPYKICLALLIICLIINIPNNMAQEMVSTEDLPFKLRYCTPTSFALTSYGKILLTTSYIIQGPVVLVLIIISNVWSVVSFRIFLKRKSELTHTNPGGTQSEQNLKKQKSIDKKDKNLLKMTVVLTSFSSVTLFFYFIGQLLIFVFISLFNNTVISFIIFLYMCAMDLKQFTNIFFIYFFNKSFRSNFWKLFQRSNKTINVNVKNTTTKSNSY